MGFHHVALASTDLEATHAFYTEAMGFELTKAVVAPTDHPRGWAKHIFYDTGGHGLIAFWELHDERVPTQFDAGMSSGLGLPVWVNHIAFEADDLDDLHRRMERWLDAGNDVMEIDHGFCVSVYTTDPDGTMVEWCTDTRSYTEADRRAALEALRDPTPDLEDAKTPTFHRAADRVAAG